MAKRQIRSQARMYLPDAWEAEMEVRFRDRWSGGLGYRMTNIGHIEKTANGYEATIGSKHIDTLDTMLAAMTALLVVELGKRPELLRTHDDGFHHYFRYQPVKEARA